MRKSTLFQLSCLAFVLGVILTEFIVLSLSFLYFIFLVCLVLLVFNLLFINKKIFWQITLILIFILLGSIRYHYNTPKASETDIQFYNNSPGLIYKDLKNSEFIGLVNDNPQRKIDHQKLTIKTRILFEDEQEKEISGNVLIKVPLYPVYQYGDLLKVNCPLQKPAVFEIFNYAKYLARHNIYSVCYSPWIEILDKDQGNIIKAQILNFKLKIEKIINKNLLEPQASILKALLIGVTKDMDPEIIEDFSLAGVSHIIAISGMHIALWVNFIMNFFLSLGLWRKKALYLTIIIIILYLALIGFKPSAIRAAIMGFSALLALNIGRLNTSVNALLLAGAIMTLMNPWLPIIDLGFQFSFLAVLGLIYLQSDIEELFKFLPKIFGIRQNLSTTLAAQVFTLPWLVYKLGNLSIIAPITNIFILPIAPLILMSGSIAVVGSLILPLLGQILFWFVWLIIGYLVFVVKMLIKIKFSYLIINDFPVWILIVFYLLILMVVYFLKNKKATLVHVQVK